MTLTPEKVFPVLDAHMLVDGYRDMVVDLNKSEGNYIYDSLHHRKYLDMFSFFATAPIGYNHPKMHEPEFKEKLLSVALLKPSNSDFYTTEMAEFVKVFSDHAIPEYLPYLFLISGGALAVENALKAAFDWKVRKNMAKGLSEHLGTQVIHFQQAFHGRSGYTMSLTNTDIRKIKYFPKFNWPRVSNPYIEFPLTDENIEGLIAREKKSVEEIKQAIQDNKNDIASIIIEPIQGEGGDNHFREEFFVELRTLADENDMMLIYDEVQTGIGLTGKMWCHEHYAVKPDMLVFGKKTQVCGFLCSKRIDDVENNVFHESSRLNSTWGGSLVDMVRFQRYLEIIMAENLIENARVVGNYFLESLHELADDTDRLISNVRGRGLMIAFTLPENALRDKMLKLLFENGLIALASGEKAVRFRPTLSLKKAHVDETIGILKTSLQSLRA